MKKFLFVSVLSCTLLFACKATPSHPLLQESAIQPINHFSSFAHYQTQTKTALLKHRYFLSEHHQQELQANMPFERRPKHSEVTKGVLLIHGLGDSPFSFTDIADGLVKQGYLVRTVLLSGHGTRPADMMRAKHNDWQALVEKQLALLKQEVREVYLGGFSTGGNLAYLQASKDESVKGLMLFSPAFKSNEPLAPYVGLLKPFKRWLLTGDPENETNYVRYGAMPTNGFAQYQATARAAQKALQSSEFTRPVYMVLSEHDSVLDAAYIKAQFTQRFTHAQSRLLWFGAQPSREVERIYYINSYMPELRIRNMSHMGMLFSPENPYYGIGGRERICRNHNGERAQLDETRCLAGEEVWYSAWDGQEGEEVHARLTFNPIFTQMMQHISLVFQSAQ